MCSEWLFNLKKMPLTQLKKKKRTHDMTSWNFEQISHVILSFQQFSERSLNGNVKILGLPWWRSG